MPELIDRMFSLKEKTALITGGYKGIGLAISEVFAEAGAKLALAARSGDICKAVATSIEAQFGVEAFGLALDVQNSQQISKALEEIIARFGKIDILVNCAGIDSSRKPFMEITEEDMNTVMRINFHGTFLVSKAVAREMIKLKSGKIINVASILGKIAVTTMADYCASKAAMIQLTRVMALDLMRYNIQVNALCPGYFLTDINRKYFESDPTAEKFIKKIIPLNRIGHVDELKSSALYLATGPSFLTGTEIYVDGGSTIV
jgi:NAD(P)-dependent dehydrogenase (short-subunit alcohol dehydrogenase family)